MKGELMIGALIGMIAGAGAVSTQTDWWTAPTVIAAGYEWEPITEDPVRTHEMTVQYWWEIDHGNDPTIPDDMEEASIIAGELYGIAPEIFQAMGDVESDYKADAENGEYKGWLQVSAKWHGWRLAEMGLCNEDLFDPYVCANVAASYLSELLEKYDGDMALALMAYGGNTSGIRRYYKTGKISAYAEEILTRSAELERAHGK